MYPLLAQFIHFMIAENEMVDAICDCSCDESDKNAAAYIMIMLRCNQQNVFWSPDVNKILLYEHETTYNVY